MTEPTPSTIENSSVTSQGPMLSQIEHFTSLAKALRKGKLAKNQTPAAMGTKVAQKQAEVQLMGVKKDVAIAGMLAAIAKQIGMDTLTLHSNTLRGAMLTIVDQSKDPAVVQRWVERDAVYVKSTQRKNEGVKAFVPAAKPGGELAGAAKVLGLTYNGLHGGYEGRASVLALVELALHHNCTVRVRIRGNDETLVENGVLDETILGRASDAQALAAGIDLPEGAQTEAAVGPSIADVTNALVDDPGTSAPRAPEDGARWGGGEAVSDEVAGDEAAEAAEGGVPQSTEGPSRMVGTLRRGPLVGGRTGAGPA